MNALLRASSLCLLLLAASSQPGVATTWDEPWHDEVVAAADSLVKVQVLELEEHGEWAKVKRTLQVAGKATPEEFKVSGYFLLGLTSTSGGDHGHFGLRLKAGRSYYLFLKHEADGRYLLPTPTTGYADLDPKGEIYATYRHSYHMAKVPEALYRSSQQLIFEASLAKKAGEAKQPEPKALEAVLEVLGQEPQDVSEDPAEMARFFGQHVALETLFHLEGAGKSAEELLKLIEPFLALESYHGQISAVRALGRVDTPAGHERLVAFLGSDSDNGFAKIMAVWALARLNARKQLPALKALLPKASAEDTGFGGNLMDPRIGTSFPRSVKSALERLVTTWEQPAEDEKR